MSSESRVSRSGETRVARRIPCTTRTPEHVTHNRRGRTLTSPAPPAEAVLLRERRESLGLSRYEVARRAGRGVSEPTVRRYESAAEVTRDPHVIAQVAAVLSVTPDELGQAGREDAASALRALAMRAAASPDVLQVAGAGRGDDAGWQGLMGEILAGLAQIDGIPGLTGAERAQMRAAFLDGLRGDAAAWRRGLTVARQVQDYSG